MNPNICLRSLVSALGELAVVKLVWNAEFSTADPQRRSSGDETRMSIGEECYALFVWLLVRLRQQNRFVVGTTLGVFSLIAIVMTMVIGKG
jgi:hypothetical protein